MRNPLGNRLSPAVKYWIFLTGIIAVIFTVIFGSFAASFLNLAPEEQAFFKDLFDKLIPFPFIGAILLVAFICSMISLLFRYYIIPVLRMAEQTRLITAANPHYRIVAGGARELTSLARVINETADAYQELQHEVDSRVRQANLALEDERNRFAALMSELPCGVVVCNRDGRILLYNHLARAMLQTGNGARDGAGAVGLGRSIFGVLDRDPLVHALEVMTHAFARDQVKPALGMMTQLCGSRFIRVNMAPVSTTGEKRDITGFVLSLEDISGEVNADNEQDRLLQLMVDSVQKSLGKLYQGLHSIDQAPGTGDGACSQHRQTITQVTRDLEEQLALARRLFSEHRRAYGNRENVLADTLMQLIAKNLDERFAMQTVRKEAEPVWLKIDSYAIVQALTTLAGLLKAEYEIPALTLEITRGNGPFAELLLGWSAASVSTRAVQAWRTTPLFMDSDGTKDSPESIITAHGGTIASMEAGTGLCQGLRVSLPTALDEETDRWTSPIAPRPVSYEFDLFHQPGQSTLGKIPLRKLTYVAFDTETTGLNPSEGDEIIQLGAVRIVNNRLLRNECIDQLINPQRPVPKSSVAIHGIDPDLLAEQPLITEVLPDFHSFAADAVLVAHNAAFDMRFLQLKEEAAGLHFDNPVLDTLLLSSVVHPHQEGHSLDVIAERFNIRVVGRHTALGDALVTAEILLKLIPLLEAQGIHTLEEALDAAMKSPFAKIRY